MRRSSAAPRVRSRGSSPRPTTRSSIHPTALLNVPYRRLADGSTVASRGKTQVGKGCQVRQSVCIMSGTRIGNEVIIDPSCIVEQDVDIDDRCLLTYRAYVCNNSKIGEESIIGGFVGERSVIGRRNRIFGSLIHAMHDPALPWDEVEEPAPVLGDDVVVGFGSVVVGGVHISPRVFIGANATISKSVPPDSIVTGVNNIVPARKWAGQLSRSRFFGDHTK